MLGRREAAAAVTAAAAAGSRETDVEVAAPLPTTPPPASGRDVTTPPAPARALVGASKADGAKLVSRGEASIAPCSEPPHEDGGDGGGDRRSSSADVARKNRTGSKKRPYTTERKHAKDLAQYLGVSGPDNDNGSGGTEEWGGDTRRGEKRGAGGSALEVVGERDERDGTGGEGQVRGSRQGVRCS